MEWVKDRVSQMGMDYDQMIEYIKDTPAGSNGVVFSPWMHGNRCPFDDANSRGVFFNLDITTRGSDLMKAVIEGVCLHMRWLLECTEKTFPYQPGSTLYWRQCHCPVYLSGHGRCTGPGCGDH